MKIVLITENLELSSFFINGSRNNIPSWFKERSLDIQDIKDESKALGLIGDPSIDGFVIDYDIPYKKKLIDFLKRKSPYVPVALFGPIESIIKPFGADIHIPFTKSQKEFRDYVNSFFLVTLWNIYSYLKNFDKLKKLTTRQIDSIEFGTCRYDPIRRILYYKEKPIKKLSAKEGGILEILASNLGQVVKKEIILEKIWHKADYFTGRSMDVYVTHLRKLLRTNRINFTITNVSGVGLILE